MLVFKKNGSKDRLFEIMERVNKIKLSESNLSKENRNVLIKNFVDFISKKINLGNELPRVILTYNEGEAKTNTSFGSYSPQNNEIKIVAINRNMADILRTLAHELIHYSQQIEGKLDINSGEDGSDQENEANSLAGVIMREFGKIYPIIFE